MKNKFKEIEKQFRELGIEGDDVFTLIAVKYIKLLELELSDRLNDIIYKSENINCNGSKNSVEKLTRRIVTNYIFIFKL